MSHPKGNRRKMVLLRGKIKFSKLNKFHKIKSQSYSKLQVIISAFPFFLEICLSPHIFKFYFKLTHNCNNFIRLTGGNHVKA